VEPGDWAFVIAVLGAVFGVMAWLWFKMMNG
jgi:hypothetical protein